MQEHDWIGHCEICGERIFVEELWESFGDDPDNPDSFTHVHLDCIEEQAAENEQSHRELGYL